MTTTVIFRIGRTTTTTRKTSCIRWRWWRI